MKLTFATVAALASCLALNAAAQSNAVSAAALGSPAVPTGAPKYVISFQEAVAQTNDFQRRFADLQKKYDPKRQQIKTLSDEIAGLQKELQAQAATMSDADRAAKAKLLDSKQKELKWTGDDAQTDPAGHAADLRRRSRKVCRNTGCLRSGVRIQRRAR